MDGTYQFKKTSVGKLTIKVDYTGYLSESKEIQIANVNETKVVDINLRSTSVNLSSVTVSSSNKDNDNSIRKLEKIADPIINVLSAKNIQLLPDITVANALQRISGVTIEKSGSGEARYPIIRGMEKRYINTLVNGIKIPSPDNKNRFIPLDLFPSELLERLEVGKSLTPSLEGDAIGGTINLVMKDAPDHLIVQGNVASGFNTSFPDQTFSKFDNSTMNHSSPAGEEWFIVELSNLLNVWSGKEVLKPLATLPCTIKWSGASFITKLIVPPIASPSKLGVKLFPTSNLSNNSEGNKSNGIKRFLLSGPRQ